MHGGAPGLEELSALATRAAELVDGDGLVNVLWEAGALSVAITAVRDGRAARLEAAGPDPAQLARAAKAAALRARQARAWPAPAVPAVPATPAGGTDGGRPGRGERCAPGAMAPRSRRSPARGAIEVDWETGVGRTVVATTTGLLAAEERAHAIARVHGPRPGGQRVGVTVALADTPDPAATEAAVAGGRTPVEEAHADVRALLGEGDGRFVPRVPDRAAVAPDARDDLIVVLAPEAVAAVLDRLRSAFGVDATLGAGLRAGDTVASELVTLRDDAGHPATAQRAFDAEGTPRAAVDLVRHGVVAGRVTDRATAGVRSTGHATRALTMAPLPDHLVLDGGDAAGAAELCDGVRDGLFVTALRRDPGDPSRHLATGTARIAGGRVRGRLPDLPLALDPAAVLAAVDGLTAGRRLVPLRGQCPGGIGAALVPALRATAGVAIAR